MADRHCIFAWTETNAPEGFPGYVNISRDENGKHTITVRSRGNAGRDTAIVEIPPEALESLLCDLADDLYRDEAKEGEAASNRARGLRGAASALERAEPAPWQPGAGSAGFTLPPPIDGVAAAVEPHPCRWFNGKCIDCGRSHGAPRGVAGAPAPQPPGVQELAWVVRSLCSSGSYYCEGSDVPNALGDLLRWLGGDGVKGRKP